MPPRRLSRFTFSEGTALTDLGDERLFLTEREPFRFQEFEDNKTHVVKDGETLFSLSGRYFRGLPRPAGLFWIVCDFQPQPIFDPTLALVPGQVLIFPSVRTVEEVIFAQKRRLEG